MHYYIVFILYYTVGSIVLNFGIFGPLEGSQSKGISGSWPYGCLTLNWFQAKKYQSGRFLDKCKGKHKDICKQQSKNRCLLWLWTEPSCPSNGPSSPSTHQCWPSKLFWLLFPIFPHPNVGCFHCCFQYFRCFQYLQSPMLTKLVVFIVALCW